jgi:apolipoprotein D and lipocalin family protein
MNKKMVVLFFFLAAVPLLAMTNSGYGSFHDLRNDTVKNFKLQRYLGTWYELARFNHPFEKDLTCVTATYSLDNKGGVVVLNQGMKKGKLSKAKGWAWVPDPNHPSSLLVGFFLFFAAPYYIVELDPDYNYALVLSGSKDYLWILCRQKTMDEHLFQHLLSVAREYGLDTDNTIRVAQDCP